MKQNRTEWLLNYIHPVLQATKKKKKKLKLNKSLVPPLASTDR